MKAEFEFRIQIKSIQQNCLIWTFGKYYSIEIIKTTLVCNPCIFYYDKKLTTFKIWYASVNWCRNNPKTNFLVSHLFDGYCCEMTWIAWRAMLAMFRILYTKSICYENNWRWCDKTSGLLEPYVWFALNASRSSGHDHSTSSQYPWFVQW